MHHQRFAVRLRHLPQRDPQLASRLCPAKRAVATGGLAAREVAILEWIADADDPDVRMATARGPEVAAVLAAAGHHLSARTARRDLQAVRDQLATVSA